MCRSVHCNVVQPKKQKQNAYKAAQLSALDRWYSLNRICFARNSMLYKRNPTHANTGNYTDVKLVNSRDDGRPATSLPSTLMFRHLESSRQSTSAQAEVRPGTFAGQPV